MVYKNCRLYHESSYKKEKGDDFFLFRSGFNTKASWYYDIIVLARHNIYSNRNVLVLSVKCLYYDDMNGQHSPQCCDQYQKTGITTKKAKELNECGSTKLDKIALIKWLYLFNLYMRERFIFLDNIFIYVSYIP